MKKSLMDTKPVTASKPEEPGSDVAARLEVFAAEFLGCIVRVL